MNGERTKTVTNYLEQRVSDDSKNNSELHQYLARQITRAIVENNKEHHSPLQDAEPAIQWFMIIVAHSNFLTLAEKKSILRKGAEVSCQQYPNLSNFRGKLIGLLNPEPKVNNELATRLGNASEEPEYHPLNSKLLSVIGAVSCARVLTQLEYTSEKNAYEAAYEAANTALGKNLTFLSKKILAPILNKKPEAYTQAEDLTAYVQIIQEVIMVQPPLLQYILLNDFYRNSYQPLANFELKINGNNFDHEAAIKGRYLGFYPRLHSRRGRYKKLEPKEGQTTDDAWRKIFEKSSPSSTLDTTCAKDNFIRIVKEELKSPEATLEKAVNDVINNYSSIIETHAKNWYRENIISTIENQLACVIQNHLAFIDEITLNYKGPAKPYDNPHYLKRYTEVGANISNPHNVENPSKLCTDLRNLETEQYKLLGKDFQELETEEEGDTQGSRRPSDVDFRFPPSYLSPKALLERGIQDTEKEQALIQNFITEIKKFREPFDFETRDFNSINSLYETFKQDHSDPNTPVYFSLIQFKTVHVNQHLTRAYWISNVNLFNSLTEQHQTITRQNDAIKATKQKLEALQSQSKNQQTQDEMQQLLKAYEAMYNLIFTNYMHKTVEDFEALFKPLIPLLNDDQTKLLHSFKKELTALKDSSPLNNMDVKIKRVIEGIQSTLINKQNEYLNVLQQRVAETNEAIDRLKRSNLKTVNLINELKKQIESTAETIAQRKKELRALLGCYPDDKDPEIGRLIANQLPSEQDLKLPIPEPTPTNATQQSLEEIKKTLNGHHETLHKLQIKQEHSLSQFNNATTRYKEKREGDLKYWLSCIQTIKVVIKGNHEKITPQEPFFTNFSINYCNETPNQTTYNNYIAQYEKTPLEDYQSLKETTTVDSLIQTTKAAEDDHHNLQHLKKMQEDLLNGTLLQKAINEENLKRNLKQAMRCDVDKNLCNSDTLIDTLLSTNEWLARIKNLYEAALRSLFDSKAIESISINCKIASPSNNAHRQIVVSCGQSTIYLPCKLNERRELIPSNFEAPNLLQNKANPHHKIYGKTLQALEQNEQPTNHAKKQQLIALWLHRRYEIKDFTKDVVIQSLESKLEYINPNSKPPYQWQELEQGKYKELLVNEYNEKQKFKHNFSFFRKPHISKQTIRVYLQSIRYILYEDGVPIDDKIQRLTGLQNFRQQELFANNRKEVRQIQNDLIYNALKNHIAELDYIQNFPPSPSTNCDNYRPML